jgi:serine protease AprX
MARRPLVTLFLVVVFSAAPCDVARASGDGRGSGNQGGAGDHEAHTRLDPVLIDRAHTGAGTSRIIVQAREGADTAHVIRSCGGVPGQRFRTMAAQLAEVADTCLEWMAAHPDVLAISLDRPVRGALQRTIRATIGATWVAERLGFDGTGIGVAIIDSGVAAWHEDLGHNRVVHFADFVNRQKLPYDDYGHGTHVAGIISGNGESSAGAHRGIAPGAHLIALKALDSAGDGNVSHVIAAIDYAVRHRTAFNIRVINLSVAAGVHESYNTDPLTQAARRAVDAGIVVVTAAGNLGRDVAGALQYGGITAPGNAPWVLTVGASDDNGTADRRDDKVARFSSRGPALIDGSTKPDLVAPGVGIESLADAGSLLYLTRPRARRWGTVKTANEPYLALSGTSMAAPVVAGTVALMLQANAALSPEQVKAILQRTAENVSGYDQFTQGAGFLNARAAVEMAGALAADAPPLPAEDGTR